MKKSVLVLILAVFLAFAACSFTQFDGSRTGNANQLVMKYQVLNRTDSQVLELQEGDYLDFVVASESGKVDILLQKEGDTPAYSGVDVPTSAFAVKIGETGSYTVTVTGDNARGSVSVVKRQG